MTTVQARAVQLRGSHRVSIETSLALDKFRNAGRVAAVDVAYDRPIDRCFAALVVWDVKSGTVLSSAVHDEPARFPYVPGLLSFREIPPLLPLLEALPNQAFDLLLCDGQGIAHPRRFGLACHLGVIFDCPAVGWAKSRLIGNYREPAPSRRSATQLRIGDEQIGWALRSRERCNPTFVSPGHRISIGDSLKLARLLMGSHRLCEPAREAHRQTNLAMHAYREWYGVGGETRS